MAAIAQPVAARWITPVLAEQDPALVVGLHDMLCSVDPESYAQCCEAIATMDLRADLRRITAPTLVIAGAQDLAIPPSHAFAIADNVAGAQLDVVDEAAHIATVEHSGRITARLIEHFVTGRDRCAPDSQRAAPSWATSTSIAP